MSSAPKATSGPSAAPKVRRTRDELRDLVLQAGRDVLLSEGLGTGAEHLTFKRVLPTSRPPRGSGSPMLR